MIDGSHHAKARALACHTCIACVEKTGLAAVGKKGVLSTAKLLSQETRKYRDPPLDLMEMILSKMNGDIQRLTRICGPNLSEKAKQLLEERWRKRGAPEDATPSTSRRVSPPQDLHTLNVRQQQDIYDELPRLSLRVGVMNASKPSPKYREECQDDNASDDPFAFSVSALRNSSPTSTKSEANDPTTLETNGAESFPIKSTDIEPSGAAALLRARLQKLREKEKTAEESAAVDDIGQTQFVTEVDFRASEKTEIDCDSQMECIRDLLRMDGPMLDSDPEIEACIGVLRLFHSALSGQHHPALGMTPAQFSCLRKFLIENTNVAVDLLTRYAHQIGPGYFVKLSVSGFLPVFVLF